MKAKTLFILLITALGIVSCSDCYTVDWAPVNIFIEAEDSNGNDIIKEEMPGMTLSYKGVIYEVKNSGVNTKSYFAQMYGLYFQKGSMYSDEPNPKNRLIFGEIDGAADMDEEIIITWPDGTKNIINYHCSNHKEGRNPKCKRNWKLDGKKHDGSIFKFVK